MIKHTDSHLDHGLSPEIVAYLLERFADRKEFFKETIELPTHLGMVPCGLFGPIMGDDPVTPDNSDVSMLTRGDRPYQSRVIDRRPRLTSKVSVIAGPHTATCDKCKGTGEYESLSLMVQFGGPLLGPCPFCVKGVRAYPCVIYTAFGGPIAPQEPGDPTCRDPEASASFWKDHALSVFA